MNYLRMASHGAEAEMFICDQLSYSSLTGSPSHQFLGLWARHQQLWAKNPLRRCKTYRVGWDRYPQTETSYPPL